MFTKLYFFAHKNYKCIWCERNIKKNPHKQANKKKKKTRKKNNNNKKRNSVKEVKKKKGRGQVTGMRTSLLQVIHTTFYLQLILWSFLHLGVIFIQIYCVNDKLPHPHCRFYSKYIFICCGYSEHVTVPNEPAEVHSSENIISIDAHVQKDIQELLPHFHIFCRKKKNDCICWRLFFLPRIHCFLQWKVPYKRNWTSQRGVWSLRTFKLPSNPGCSMIHLVDTDKDTVSPCHLNLPPFPKPKQSKEKYSLFHH